jgi:hypothetical protein
MSEDGVAFHDLARLTVDDTDLWDDASLAEVLRDLEAIAV